MTSYAFPELHQRPQAEPKTVYTVASGDLRLTTNLKTWAMQQQVEAQFAAAVEDLGWSVHRAHGVDEAKGHGFIDNQRRGMDVFRDIPAEAPLVVVEAVWQYSHHVLAGLRDHQGPILVVANFAGDFPGLVGLLNLTGSMTKAGIAHGSIRKERKMPRPGRFWCTSSASPSPISSFSTSDTRTMTMVFQMAL